MNDYPSYKTRPISAIAFIIGAILIVALLLISVYFGRKYVLSVQKPNNTEISKKSDEKLDQAKEEASKSEAEAKEKAAEEKKKADEAATKAAEDKKKQEEAAAAQQQAQANAAANAAADPSHVASTGPEDTPIAVLGVFALSYAAYRFYDSRKNTSLNNY
jgi:FtsZ-interacting cell division protein ZipA